MTEGVYAAEFLYIPRRGTVGARHASPANFQHLSGKNRRKRPPGQRKSLPLEGGAPRSESKIYMTAGGSHTSTMVVRQRRTG